MRTIKLRMWNGFSKRYHYDVENVFTCLSQQNVNDKTMETRGFTHEYNHFAEGSFFEQFTGLEDKKGIDIYEGDILQGDNSILYKVFFDKGAFMASTEKYFIGDDGIDCKERFAKPNYLGDFELKSIKIIGNIHENPELLK